MQRRAELEEKIDSVKTKRALDAEAHKRNMSTVSREIMILEANLKRMECNELPAGSENEYEGSQNTDSRVLPTI